MSLARFTTRNLPTALKGDGSNDSVIFTGYTVPFETVSIAFWYFHVSGNTANDRIVDWQGAGPTDGFTFSLTSEHVMTFSIRNSGTTQASISTPTLVPGRWYFIVATYEVDSAKLYISDLGTIAQTGSTDTSVEMTDATGESLTILRRSNSVSNFSRVGISDFMIFGKVLALTEIEKLFYGRVIPSGCEIHCPFTEDGTNLIPGGIDGTVAGTPSFALPGKFKSRTSS